MPTEMRFQVLGSEETMIRDTGWYPCPQCTMSAMYQTGVWIMKHSGIPNEIEMIGYDRRCWNGHDWRAEVMG